MRKNRFLHSSVNLIVIGLLAAATFYGLLFATTSVVNATTYNAHVTGYAFGYIGAHTGHVLTQYDFANHPAGYCSDPTGNWNWGTSIRMNNPVTMHGQQNNAFTNQWFYLHDNGDVLYKMGLAWADLHFGRWKDQYQGSCTCGAGNVDNPACDPGFNGVNNCYDALNFGNFIRGYTR
jgi:hypothetical protein